MLKYHAPKWLQHLPHAERIEYSTVAISQINIHGPNLLC